MFQMPTLANLGVPVKHGTSTSGVRHAAPATSTNPLPHAHRAARLPRPVLRHLRVTDKPLHLLFLDDSFSSKSRIAALTAILLPAAEYARLQTGYFRAFGFHGEAASDQFHGPAVLHGMKFLPNEPDSRKLQVLNDVVDYVLANEVEVYRVGYYIRRNIPRTFVADPHLEGPCWISILSILEPILETSTVIPVMDGFDRERVGRFSRMIKFMDAARMADRETMLSIRHSESLIGETFYADSRYSIFVQLADVIGFLRSASDLIRDGKDVSEFKARVADVSERLAPAIACEHVIALNLNGRIQGPPDRAKAPFKGRGPVTAAYTGVASDATDLVAQARKRRHTGAGGPSRGPTDWNAEAEGE